MRDLVQEINRRTGSGLVYLEPAELGETGGAAFVAWPNGRQGVLTLATVPIARMKETAEVLTVARALDLPVPQHDLVLELDDVVAVVQERMPGSSPSPVDAAVIDTLVAANDDFADVLVGRPDVLVPPLHLDRSGPVFPRHETLENYNDRSRRLLRRIREIGAREPHEMVGNDLVHTDYTVPNILVDEDGMVTGIVDWNNGAVRGDRRFALIKLLFDLTWDSTGPDGGRHHVQPSALNRLETILTTTIEPPLLEMYWAHWTLTMLHWTILSGQADVIDLHLRLGERGLN